MRSRIILLIRGAYCSRVPGQENLVRGLQLCGAIEAIANPEARLSAWAALRALVVLPKSQRARKSKTSDTKVNAKQADRVEKLKQAGVVKAASEELRQIARRKKLQFAALGPVESDKGPKLPSADRLSKSDVAALSAETRTLFVQFDLPQEGLYLPLAIEHLENYANVELAWMMKPPIWALTPGRQPVPQSVGRARIAGLNDLLVVRQTLDRYELGEIAHIENVMRGESFGREYRRKDASEIIDHEETERTESLERDLQTTSKFEPFVRI